MPSAALRTEPMREGFTKYHLLGVGQQPFAIHHITSPDLVGPHDHPWDFTTHILQGWYRQQCWFRTDRGYESRIDRLQRGEAHAFEAEHIHEIVQVSPGGCVTAVVTGERRRDPLFWRFGHDVRSAPKWQDLL